VTAGHHTRGAAPFGPAVTERYLQRYLREAPLAVALWRSAEASALSEVELAHPIVDVGCGFGEFGRLFFRDRDTPEAGVDINRAELVRAAANPPYGSIVQCDARRLPFAEASLGSVISVSTLEHIPDVAAAIAAVARALRPGGVFAYTVPIDAFDRNMLGYRALRVMSPGLADRYAGQVNRLLTHVNIWPASRWATLTEDGGLRVQRVTPFLSPGATAVYELLLPLALASRVWRRVVGRRPPHPAPLRQLAALSMRSLIAGASPEGSNILVVATKPA
jgi:SAM-dependent methyltransferase